MALSPGEVRRILQQPSHTMNIVLGVERKIDDLLPEKLDLLGGTATILYSDLKDYEFIVLEIVRQAMVELYQRRSWIVTAPQVRSTNKYLILEEPHRAANAETGT